MDAMIAPENSPLIFGIGRTALIVHSLPLRPIIGSVMNMLLEAAVRAR